MYSRKTHAFSSDDIYHGLALAAHVAVALAASEKEEQLESRTIIGHAEGILMERFGIDAEQAFNVLRRVSQDRNVKLNLIPEELGWTRRAPGIERD